MENVGKIITDFYCNGYFGRRYDLENAVIEAEGLGWIVIRIKDLVPEPLFTSFYESEDKQYWIDQWTKEKE